MNLLVALQGTAIGLLLASDERKHAFWPALIFVMAALVISTGPFRVEGEQVLAVPGAAIIMVAVLLYFARSRLPVSAILLHCVIAGIWCGMALHDRPPADLALLSPILLFVPASWAVAQGFTFWLQIAFGWLFAVALLSAALPLFSTPGYVPSHME